MLGQSHLPILMRMRQVCIYPDLIREVVNRYVKDDGIDKASLHESTMPGLDGKSKLNAVLHKVLERKDNGRAKLIFSHFRREIDWLCESFAKSGLKCAYIDGRINHKERADIMKSTDYDVVVLQIRTACEGLNLQQFKEVYFTSPHWNPFVEDQAVARSHRFGQTEDVDVFRFEMDAFEDGKTLDGYCRMVQEKKRELSKELLG
jgi:non-specific serine/threonine protein kinase